MIVVHYLQFGRVVVFHCTVNCFDDIRRCFVRVFRCVFLARYSFRCVFRVRCDCFACSDRITFTVFVRNTCIEISFAGFSRSAGLGLSFNSSRCG